MTLTKEDFASEVEVIDRGYGEHAFNGTAYFWYIVIAGLNKLSIYYDIDDSLGIVGSHYFELYDGEETYRWLEEEKDELCSYVDNQYTNYLQEVEDYPERFL